MRAALLLTTVAIWPLAAFGDNVQLGAYIGTPGDPNAQSQFASFTSAMGQAPQVLDYSMGSTNWNTTGDGSAASFAQYLIGNAAQDQAEAAAIPLVGFHMDLPSDGTLEQGLTNEANGTHDAANDAAFAVLATQHKTIDIRPDWEFNSYVPASDASLFAAAFAHFAANAHAWAAANGVTINIVWNPMEGSSSPAAYYPGNQYVDIIGLDRYGEGTGQSDAAQSATWDVPQAAAFAVQQGKPFAMPETGAAATDTAWPANLASALTLVPGLDLAFVNVWDDPSGGNTSLFWSGTPTSAAAWKQAFTTISGSSPPTAPTPGLSGDPASSSSSNSGQACTATVAGAVTPNNGTFAVGSNTYSVDATDGNVASINGAPINNGAYGTSQLIQVGDGNIYGQDDNTHQWFLLEGSGGDTWWQPVSALPTGNQAPVATTRWATAQPCTAPTAPASTAQSPSVSPTAPTLATITPPTATVPAALPVTPLPPATPQQVNDNSKCGTFTTANGQIIGPNGQPWVADGIAVLGSQIGTVSPQSLISQFPGLNSINLAIGADGNGYQSAPSNAAIEAWVLQANALGVTVMLSDYVPGQPQVRSGTDLTNQLAWYASLAKDFVGDPYVMWTTENEVGGDLTAEDQGVYNAIRGAGNNGLIFFEADDGNASSTSGLNPGVFSGMTNVGWNIHVYPWEFNTGSGNQAGYDSTLKGFVSTFQNFAQSANGVMPVIVGEGGNSTAGNNSPVDDPTVNGKFAVTQAILDEAGAAGGTAGYEMWLLNWQGEGGDADTLVSGGALTDFGQQVVSAMTTSTPATCQQQPAAVTEAITTSTPTVTPITSLGPALSLGGGMTVTPGNITPANTIGN